MSKFGTKGKTLQMLQHKLSHAQILPIFIFTVDDWIHSKVEVTSKVAKLLGDGPWIVRSSSTSEDNQITSNAGAFVSILDVNIKKLEEAINAVISSYKNESLTEEVLIQPMLKNVEMSGVAFSHDPNTGSPDRIINWAEGHNTQAVTSGLDGNVCQIAAGHSKAPKGTFLAPVSDLIEELLAIFNETPLDCEFAINRQKRRKTLWLLQVRPLVLASKPKSIAKHTRQLTLIKEKIKIGMRAKPYLMGKRAVYGIMPDWNPAEIIGRRPKPLAMSLYQELITDSIWAYQRHNYGYRNLRSYPLMLNFSGVPYIDVRVSFNSFVPADLEDNIAGPLVDYYLDKLVSHPNLHDKVEFEIVSSCYTFDLQNNLTQLKDYGFSKKEQNLIAESLLNLTNRVLNPQTGLWRADAEKLILLNSKYWTVKSSHLTSIEKIYWLLEDCKRYGTLPFAGLARAAFIGVQMLRSLVHLNIFSKENYREFMESVVTVSSQMIYEKEIMGKNDFLKKYGHLRPGTYDILSQRYDAKPQLYFDWSTSSKKTKPIKKKFEMTHTQRKIINKMLNSNKVHTDSDNLMEFIRSAIELREKAKFEFTRNLSEALSLIESVGAQNDLSVDDLSYCNLSAFRDLYFTAANIKDVISQSITNGKTQYQETLGLSLPPLITRPDDVMSFVWPRTDPNYITQKKVIASTTTSTDKNEIANKIVCIPNADPGYDWIFSYPIAGFITTWGGVNSHMAIRAGEQKVPAVIGAGEVLFHRWSSSKRLMIDCAEQRVEIIQ